MIFGHGGNKQALASRLNCSTGDIIDLSSNLNPLGPPDFIERAICDNLHRVKALPEPDAMTLRKGFARFYGLDHTCVLAGNGTTWFIYTLPQALNPRRALIVGPTYSDYKDACVMHQVAYDHCHSSADHRFMPDVDQISARISTMAASADMVFICNPNNPTGALLSREKIKYLLKRHKNTFFVIDESYLPFVDQARDISLVSDKEHDNLIVLSSMSKIFRIPGLRTGFLSAPRPVIEKIMAWYQPWSVNALAQAVITHVFDHPEKIEPFFEQTRSFIKTEKSVFLDQTASLDGIEFYDSAAYFLLARLTGVFRSAPFCDQIGNARLLIRDCENFEGLSDRYVRFSLKNRDINQQLADQIRQVLGHPGRQENQHG